jgi:ankyrin repeat protein
LEDCCEVCYLASLNRQCNSDGTILSIAPKQLTTTKRNCKRKKKKCTSEDESSKNSPSTNLTFKSNPICRFVEENPGRQSISGSFNPIDVGEWSDQVYIKPTQQLFSAIASHDRAAVQKVLQEGTIDLNQRDHVGRTTLHVAIFARAADIACDLIDAGARITARLADGRAPLHLAAQYDLASVIKKLLEKNKKNVEEAEKKKKADKDGDDKMEDADAPERPSSEDDWSSDEDEDIEMSDADDEDDEDEEDEDSDDEAGNKQKKPEEKPAETGEIPEEEEDQPDIIEIDAFDWDLGFSAFSYAVLFGSIPTLEALIAGEADPKLATNPSPGHLPLHPLTLTILRDDQDEACKIAERLLRIPSVTSSTANQSMVTILHAAVSSGRTKLVETILRCDKNASSVINFPSMEWNAVVFPVVTAIHKKHYAILGTMLAHGAKLNLDEEDITRALEAA